MKYAIELLDELLQRLDTAYDKFVVNGKVDNSSLAAVENRQKAKELNEAIKILHAQNESRAINENEQAKESCDHIFKEQLGYLPVEQCKNCKHIFIEQDD